MKKYLLLFNLFLVLSVFAFAQSQRLVLFEEFTNAGCPPCALYNPSFNAILDANPTKVVAVKYQVNSPGTDVMNLQNPTQVATRDNYYSISVVPTSVRDGIYKFNPGSFTQSYIDSRYSVPSPFTITVSHYLNAARTVIYAHADITCTQAVSGSFVAHMAIIERNIYFTTAPGSNGEKHFPGVMKRMLPTDQGTALVSSWNVNNTKAIDQSWTLANVYDTNQLAVVVWVQNTSTKEVLQAGYSRPNIPRDAGIIAVSGFSGVACSSNLNAVVTLRNFTKFPMTSAVINCSVDGGAPQTYAWSGNLASDQNVLVSFPTVTLTAGKHTIKFSSSMPNGGADLDLHNDAITKTVNVVLSPSNPPLTQTFSGSLFPPTSWTVEDMDLDNFKWIRSTAGYNTTGSAMINCFDSEPGTIDNLYTPTINFSSAISGSKLEFDVAHAQCSSSQLERLKVDVSTNCGSTWTNVYNKLDPTLATVPGYVCGTSGFIPTASQWRHETISLNQFIGQSQILVRFQSISAQGNNTYIDNVNVTTGTSGITDLITDNDISLYPVPSKGEIFLNINMELPKDITVQVTNPIGETIKSFTLKNANGIYPVDLKGIATGIYFVNIKTDNSALTKRILIAE